MPITRDQLLPYPQYADVRSKFLQEVINEKKFRRIKISDNMSGVFENHLTVWFQIQEMIHAERIEQNEFIDELLEVYNELLPFQNELAMTLFIEISDQGKLREFNKTVVGIEDRVKIVFDQHSVTSYEPGAEEEDDGKGYTQSVHYLHFKFTEEQKSAFLASPSTVKLQVDHPNYFSEVILEEKLVSELQKQLK